MAIKANEISSIIKDVITNYQTELKVKNIGKVISIGDGIARVYGLEDAMSGELLQFPNEVQGMVLNLEEDTVGCVILGDDKKIKEGDVVETTGRIVQVPVGDAILGRVINAIGLPLDEKGPIAAKQFRPVEIKAPGVVDRQRVKDLCKLAF